MADTPSFLVAAKSHSALNNGDTGDDSIIGDIGSTISDAVSSSLTFTGLAIGAGLTEAWNVFPTIGNWLGGEFDRIDYKAQLADLDSDLSKYYTDHKLGIDTVGFIVGSFIPGMAGVKVLRAGQSLTKAAVADGILGDNMATSMGLLASKQEKYLEAAISQIRNTGNPVTILEANTFKAIAAGFGQQALEAAAFETFVAATMNQSPVLKDMDVSDLMWNGLVGVGLGGGIGGGLNAIFARGAVKKAANVAEKEMLPWSSITDPGAGVSTSDKILNYMEQLRGLPLTPLEGDLVARAVRTRDITAAKLELKLREEFGTLANGDQAVAQVQFDAFRVILARGNSEQNVANLIDSTAIGRSSAVTKQESKLREISKKLSTGNLDDITAEEADFWARTRVSFVKTRGVDTGAVSDTTPPVLSLTDKMRPGDTFRLSKNEESIDIIGANGRVKSSYANTNNPHRPFNLFNLNHYEVEARQLWSEHLPKWTDEVPLTEKEVKAGKVTQPHVVHESDIPLLDKVMNDGLTKIKIIPEGGDISKAYLIEGTDKIGKFVRDQKVSVGQRLQKTHPGINNIDLITDKLKSALGINFNLTDEVGNNYNGFFDRLTEKMNWSTTSGIKNILRGDMIAIDKNLNKFRSLAAIAQTLKHEEGHAIFRALLDTKGVTRANLDTMYPGMKDELVALSKKARPSYWKSKDIDMQQYLNGQQELFADSFAWLSKNYKDLDKYPAFKAFSGHLVRPISQDILDSLVTRATKLSAEEIAKMVNVDPSILRGEITDAGWNARNMERQLYKDQMANTGTRDREQLADPMHLPSWIKIVTNEVRTQDIDGNLLQGMQAVATRAREYEERAILSTASVLKEKLPDISLKDVVKHLSGGQEFFSHENSNYGTTGSAFAYVGQRVHNMIKNAREATSEIFTPILQKMSNDLDSAIEWSTLNEKLRALPNGYKYVEEVNEVTKEVRRSLDWAGKIETLATDAPARIPIKSELVSDLVKAHIGRNGERISSLKPIRNNEGFMDIRDPDTFYPIPRNPKDTPHFAFVIDHTVTGTGHNSMIYAADAEKLIAMKNSILQKSTDYTVLTKDESEQYFKSHGQFSFERTLSARNIDWELKRKGVSSSFLPVTDPAKIVSNFMEWHLQRDSSLVREAVSHRYSRQFDTLRNTASENIGAARSKLGYTGGTLAALENAVDDPAVKLIKMALDIQRTSDYPYWNSFGQMLDTGVSKVWNNIGQMWEKATSPDHLAAINAAMNKAGYGDILVDEGLYKAMNATVPRGALTSAVNKINGLLATFALRLDPLNAMNNVIGSAVLMGTELKSVVRAINQGNPEAAGKLAELTTIGSLTGKDAGSLSPTKLIANAIRRYHENPIHNGQETLKDYYKRNGFISSITDQYDQTLDALSIKAGDTLDTINSKIANAMKIAKKWGDKGEALTGNKVAEEFNRFIAADVMKQITDVAVGAGVMDSTTALTYINTFVNRTQGNYIAAQRPMMFQGPVGQAIGLFQTYQFNLLQQLLRHIENGDTKTIATMMGLQGSIYGMNGLPAFNAINTHIIGNASGNKNHTDLYQAAYSGAGKVAGDWLVYGGLSNALGVFHPDLKMNMYTRGDINPRQMTLVPVDPAKIPIVQAFGKMLGNIYDMTTQVAVGGDIFGSVMRAVEHNGVSRPLAGMAQVLEGMARPDKMVTSTSNKENILMAHDLYNLASLVRVTGGKPLDEAITNDAMFRVNAYRVRDSYRMGNIASAMKISFLSGDAPDKEQLESFAATYVKSGGTQAKFSQFMARQYKNVKESQANQLRDKLSSPQGLNLQRLMGGYELQDMSNSPSNTTSTEGE